MRYPLTITNLRGRIAVVVGGGVVGERKVRSLLAADAPVRLVSPTATEQLAVWAANGEIVWEQRVYREGDLDDAALVFAATDARAVNREIGAAAHSRGLLVNVADAPAEGNFHAPAVTRQDDLIVSVSTLSGRPGRATGARDRIAALLASDGNGKPQRPGTPAAASRQPPATAHSRSITGKAYLVGAGPGRADLITARGLALLRAADVVIYDRLVAQELLREIRPDAERIFAGKQVRRRRAGAAERTEKQLRAPPEQRRAMPQAEIDALLVNRVRDGRHVVRLKGGDGFVFGRGGEECLALTQAGLPFEVVPGVSAAIAAPAFAGIPVTHRGLASAFVVAAGHEDPTKGESMIDWSLMARAPTLVVMMGMRSAGRICEALLAHGREPDSPAAAIAEATTKRQRVVRATAACLPQAMARAEIHAPAVLIFGDVVSLHERLDWFTSDQGGAGFLPIQQAGL